MATWYGKPTDLDYHSGEWTVDSQCKSPFATWDYIGTDTVINDCLTPQKGNMDYDMPYISYLDEEDLGLEPHYDFSNLRNARMAALDLKNRIQEEEAYRYEAEDKLIQMEAENDDLQDQIDTLKAQLEEITKENCWLHKSADALQDIVKKYQEENAVLSRTNTERDSSIRKLLAELGYIQL